MRNYRFRSLGAIIACLIMLGGCSSKGGEESTPTTTTPTPSTPKEAPKETTQTSGAKPVIGVSLLTMANPFFKDMADAMQAEAQKDNYDITVTAGENDAAKQQDQVKDFIVKKVSAIILAPCNSRSVGTTIQEANKAGIPVFTADIACLDTSAKVISHIATDNYEGGKMAGKAIIEAIGGKGKVAIIDHPEVESVMLRTKGFKEVLAGEKGIQIVADLPGKGESDTSHKVAQAILERNPDLVGIFAINDPSALGAVAAIEEAGRAGKVKVISFDGMKEAKQAVKDGKIYADIIQYPDKIGVTAIQAVTKYMAGDKLPTQTLIPAYPYKKADADKDAALK